MTNQQAAAEADRVQQLRQDVERFAVHVVERARQLDWRGRAIAGARIEKYAGAGRGLQFFGKVAPQRGGAEAFMQHDDGRRLLRCRTDHAVFEVGFADAEEAL